MNLLKKFMPKFMFNGKRKEIRIYKFTCFGCDVNDIFLIAGLSFIISSILFIFCGKVIGINLLCSIKIIRCLLDIFYNAILYLQSNPNKSIF